MNKTSAFIEGVGTPSTCVTKASIYTAAVFFRCDFDPVRISVGSKERY